MKVYSLEREFYDLQFLPRIFKHSLTVKEPLRVKFPLSYVLNAR